jgi:4,5-DOPA dioxygenase extradiol
MKSNNYKNLVSFIPGYEKMPVLFVGHCSPMNAIVENEFSLSWRNMVKSIPEPKAVLCISAHWETQGSTAFHSYARTLPSHALVACPEKGA